MPDKSSLHPTNGKSFWRAFQWPVLTLRPPTQGLWGLLKESFAEGSELMKPRKIPSRTRRDRRF